MHFQKVEIVATFRHPLSAAQSLKFRNGFPIERGLALWKAYNERLLTLSQDAKKCYLFVLIGRLKNIARP